MDTMLQEKDDEIANLNNQLEDAQANSTGSGDGEFDLDGETFDLEGQLGDNSEKSPDTKLVASAFKKCVWKDFKWSSDNKAEKIAYATLDAMNKKHFKLTRDREKDKGKFLHLDWEPCGCQIACYSSPIWNLLFCFVVVIKRRRKAWVEHWKDAITAIMNEQRNFCVTQTYTKLTEYVANEGLAALPTETEMYEIVMRDSIPMEEPAEDADLPTKAFFERKQQHAILYHNTLLPIVAGASQHWRESIRHNQTISEAKWKGEVCVPCGSEAMTLLIFENARQRWVKVWHKDNSDCGRIKFNIPKKKDAPGIEEFATKYSSSTAGNAKYGGWSNDGRRRYAQLKDLVKQARDQDVEGKVENLYLKWTRESIGQGDTDPNPEACEGKKKKKRSFDDLFDTE